MLAKMTPNIGDMCEVALAAKRGGADGIAAINTVKSITNIDLNQKIGMPIVNGKSSISGYSGKAVKPIALRFIQQMRTHPELRDFPISGIGGIETRRMQLSFIARRSNVTGDHRHHAVRVSDSGRYGKRVVALSRRSGI